MQSLMGRIRLVELAERQKRVKIEDILTRSILVFAEKGKVEENGQRSCVGSENNDFADTTVEGLGGLVCALLQLTVMLSLLDEVEDLLRQSAVG
jgi:hypothetical protein